MFGVPVDMNNQEEVLSVFPVLSEMPELPLSDFYTQLHRTRTNRGVMVDSDASINGLSHASNTELEEQFTAHFASRRSLADNLSSFLISAPPIHLSDVTRTHAFNAYSDALNLNFASPMNCGYDEVVGNVMDSNGWTDHPYSSSKLSNELSLSLATSQSSIVPDQCSEHNSCNNKELSLSFATQKPPQFSQESRYLQIIQEILTQIASYSMNNSNQTSYYTTDHDRGLFSSSEANGEEKTELLSLLQAVDHGYSQCMDEINTVVSAFQAVTSLDPQKHCCFALGTVSGLYRSLRERISNSINGLGAKERSFEPSRDLQQQKRKELQLWRPQRGLPEKSVAVLRAWMFQNFLHPYPKDCEKHLLAVRSGLSRNQVSNWFINARVRLWRPMIEEMCSEMNGREGRDGYEEGGNSVRRRSWRGMNNVRYNSMN